VQPRKIGAEKIVGRGAIYQLAKNASSTNFTTPVIETTLKGKVTYLTDFPLTPTTPSTDHSAPNNPVNDQTVIIIDEAEIVL